MPRTRQLHPSFFTNEDLAKLPALTRIFFQGLWCAADREGRLEDRPERLKAQILPYDEADGEAMVVALAGKNFVHRYEVGGVRVLLVVKFKERQRIHPSEVASRLPPPPASAAAPIPHGGAPTSSERAPGGAPTCVEGEPAGAPACSERAPGGAPTCTEGAPSGAPTCVEGAAVQVGNRSLPSLPSLSSLPSRETPVAEPPLSLAFSEADDNSKDLDAEVYAHWRTQFAPRATEVLDKDRRRIIAKRRQERSRDGTGQLRDPAQVQQELLDALSCWKHYPWPERKRNARLDQLMGNAGDIDQGLRLFAEGPPRPGGDPRRRPAGGYVPQAEIEAQDFSLKPSDFADHPEVIQ